MCTVPPPTQLAVQALLVRMNFPFGPDLHRWGSSQGRGMKKLRRATAISSWVKSPSSESGPFSRSTTCSPASASGSAIGPRPAPLPPTTTSTSESAIRLALPRLAGLVVVMPRGIGAAAPAVAEADELPATPSAVPAVDRVPEQPFHGERDEQ